VTGWIILGGLAALLVLLCMTSVGVFCKYDGALLLRLTVGPVSVTVFPRKEKEKRADAKKGKSAAEQTKKSRSVQKPNKAQILYSIEVLPGILKRAFKRFGRGILVKPLNLTVVFAGEDPADTAQTYGKVQALVSALYPEIKKLIRIKNARIALSADYQREKTEFSIEAGARLRIGVVLFIALAAGTDLLRWLMGYRKLASPAVKEADQGAAEKDSQANAA